MNTVVMVDDAPITLQLYEQILKPMPEVKGVSFQSPNSALRWCESNDVDLLLLDYRMPEVDGIDFLSQFRKLGGKEAVPVVMITGELEKQTRYEALEAGVDDFLTKPIDHVEFRARVKNMLKVREHDRLQTSRGDWLAEEVSKATAMLAEREREAIVRLTRACEYRDKDRGEHIVRIGLFVARVAEALGLPQEEVDILRVAAPMHDIGKICIPDEILLKRGKLTPSEWETIKHHPLSGFYILRDSPSKLLQRGAEIALSHHERFDGTGYPFGAAGETIPLSGRITALCDVFDALLSSRPYKEAWSLEKAVEYIEQEEGKHFDPVVVAAFKEVLPDLVQICERYPDVRTHNDY
jgi:response regulator RpfG family c-di-GMP phosphodiesterase